jgi:hypothetical protein
MLDKDILCMTIIDQEGNTCNCDTFKINVFEKQVNFTCTLKGHRGFVHNGELYFENVINKRGGR